MSRLGQRVSLLFLSASASVLAGCGLLRTTGDIATSAASATVKVAAAGAQAAQGVTETALHATRTTGELGLKAASAAAHIGSSAAQAGSAAVAAGAAARNATNNAVGLAFGGLAAVAGLIRWSEERTRTSDLEYRPLTSAGEGRFVSEEGRSYLATDCAVPEGQPALLVILRDGRYEVRVAVREPVGEEIGVRRCVVAHAAP